MTDLITAAEAKRELDRLSAEMVKANADARAYALQEAADERKYREEKASRWATNKLGDEKKTAKEIEFTVDGETAELRERRDVSSVMARSLNELERDYRQQISALQSVMRMASDESEMHRAGQVSEANPF